MRRILNVVLVGFVFTVLMNAVSLDLTLSAATYSCDNNLELSMDGDYVLATAEDLDELACFVNNGGDTSGLTFSLTNDIDYSGNRYEGIGFVSSDYKAYKEFKGTFNGNGYSVSNIIIGNENPSSGGTEAAGFFVYATDAVIKDFSLKNITVDSNYRTTGALLGTGYNLVIENVFVEIGGASKYGPYSGGFAGNVAENVTMTNVGITYNADTNFYMENNNYSNISGGFTGVAVGSTSVVSNAFVKVNNAKLVFSSDWNGGFIGFNNGSTIQNSFVYLNNSTMEFTSKRAGGFAGSIQNYQSTSTGGLILNSFVDMDPSSKLIFHGEESGGFVGYAYSSSVDRSYANGTMELLNQQAIFKTGGFIGYGEGYGENLISNSFTSMLVSENSYSFGYFTSNDFKGNLENNYYVSAYQANAGVKGQPTFLEGVTDMTHETLLSDISAEYIINVLNNPSGQGFVYANGTTDMGSSDIYFPVSLSTYQLDNLVQGDRVIPWFEPGFVAPDQEAPTFSATPADGSMDLAIDEEITITFSEDVSVWGEPLSKYSLYVGINGTYDSIPVDVTITGNEIKFVPTFMKFETGVRYTIDLSSITDIAGNTISDTLYEFYISDTAYSIADRVTTTVNETETTETTDQTGSEDTNNTVSEETTDTTEIPDTTTTNDTNSDAGVNQESGNSNYLYVVLLTVIILVAGWWFIFGKRRNKDEEESEEE